MRIFLSCLLLAMWIVNMCQNISELNFIPYKTIKNYLKYLVVIDKYY